MAATSYSRSAFVTRYDTVFGTHVRCRLTPGERDLQEKRLRNNGFKTSLKSRAMTTVTCEMGGDVTAVTSGVTDRQTLSEHCAARRQSSATYWDDVFMRKTRHEQASMSDSDELTTCDDPDALDRCYVQKIVSRHLFGVGNRNSAKSVTERQRTGHDGERLNASHPSAASVEFIDYSAAFDMIDQAVNKSKDEHHDKSAVEDTVPVPHKTSSTSSVFTVYDLRLWPMTSRGVQLAPSNAAAVAQNCSEVRRVSAQGYRRPANVDTHSSNHVGLVGRTRTAVNSAGVRQRVHRQLRRSATICALVKDGGRQGDDSIKDAQQPGDVAVSGEPPLASIANTFQENSANQHAESPPATEQLCVEEISTLQSDPNKVAGESDDPILPTHLVSPPQKCRVSFISIFLPSLSSTVATPPRLIASSTCQFFKTIDTSQTSLQSNSIELSAERRKLLIHRITGRTNPTSDPQLCAQYADSCDRRCLTCLRPPNNTPVPDAESQPLTDNVDLLPTKRPTDNTTSAFEMSVPQYPHEKQLVDMRASSGVRLGSTSSSARPQRQGFLKLTSARIDGKFIGGEEDRMTPWTRRSTTSQGFRNKTRRRLHRYNTPAHSSTTIMTSSTVQCTPIIQKL